MSELITIQPNADNRLLWLECAGRWLEAVERRRGSARSRHEYQKCLKAFFAYVDKDPANVTGADCQRWLASLTETGLANTTIKTRLAAVSSFYNFACHKFEDTPGHYLHNFNPASICQRPHINLYEKAQGLNPEQTRALLKACNRQTVKGARDFALISFYLYTGRRRVEIARLKWADIRDGAEPGAREYHYTGKGSKTAWRELPGPVWIALEFYLKQSGRIVQMQPDSPLFVATQHPGEIERPLAEITVNQILDRAASRAGLEHVKVHGLRHTAAKLRRKGGYTLEQVSEFLDHNNIATTQIYLGALESKGDIGWRNVEALIGLEG